MARRNRNTLKDYFKRGQRPSERAFEDLIDSGLNTLDDGFSSSPQIGIGLAPQSEEGVVLSTFRNPGDTYPNWEFAINRKNGDLQIRCREEKEAQPIVTVKYLDDQHEDAKGKGVLVNGMLTSVGRKGGYRSGSVPANGQWQDILGPDEQLEEGCYALEVVAGCGQRNKGMYALLVATAVHCFGSRRRIRKVRSNFGVFGNKICIRWVRVKGSFKCKLQLKTFFKYNHGTTIDYHVSTLWDKPQMM